MVSLFLTPSSINANYLGRRTHFDVAHTRLFIILGEGGSPIELLDPQLAQPGMPEDVFGDITQVVPRIWIGWVVSSMGICASCAAVVHEARVGPDDRARAPDNVELQQPGPSHAQSGSARLQPALQPVLLVLRLDVVPLRAAGAPPSPGYII